MKKMVIAISIVFVGLFVSGHVVEAGNKCENDNPAQYPGKACYQHDSMGNGDPDTQVRASCNSAHGRFHEDEVIWENCDGNVTPSPTATVPAPTATEPPPTATAPAPSPTSTPGPTASATVPAPNPTSTTTAPAPTATGVVDTDGTGESINHEDHSSETNTYCLKAEEVVFSGFWEGHQDVYVLNILTGELQNLTENLPGIFRKATISSDGCQVLASWRPDKNSEWDIVEVVMTSAYVTIKNLTNTPEISESWPTGENGRICFQTMIQPETSIFCGSQNEGFEYLTEGHSPDLSFSANTLVWVKNNMTYAEFSEKEKSLSTNWTTGYNPEISEEWRTSHVYGTHLYPSNWDGGAMDFLTSDYTLVESLKDSRWDSGPVLVIVDGNLYEVVGWNELVEVQMDFDGVVLDIDGR